MIIGGRVEAGVALRGSQLSFEAVRNCIVDPGLHSCAG